MGERTQLDFWMSSFLEYCPLVKTSYLKNGHTFCGIIEMQQTMETARFTFIITFQNKPHSKGSIKLFFLAICVALSASKLLSTQCTKFRPSVPVSQGRLHKLLLVRKISQYIYLISVLGKPPQHRSGFFLWLLRLCRFVQIST